MRRRKPTASFDSQGAGRPAVRQMAQDCERSHRKVCYLRSKKQEIHAKKHVDATVAHRSRNQGRLVPDPPGREVEMTTGAFSSDAMNLALPWPPEGALRGQHVAGQWGDRHRHQSAPRRTATTAEDARFRHAEGQPAGKVCCGQKTRFRPPSGSNSGGTNWRKNTRSRSGAGIRWRVAVAKATYSR